MDSRLTVELLRAIECLHVSERVQAGLGAISAIGEALVYDGSNTASKDHVLHEPFLALLRISFQAPNPEIREFARTFLLQQQKKGFPIPRYLYLTPSEYIASTMAPSLDTHDAEVYSELALAFASDGRVSNVTRIMAMHPQFLTVFRESHNFLMYGDGPLPPTIRQLLAVLAASRHECEYLVSIHSSCFIHDGGDPSWLEGPTQLPFKYQALLPLNSLMAHTPWIIGPSHISKLVKSGVDGWSVPDLVHAVVILAHFHSLCGFVFGCAVNPEPDSDFGVAWETGTKAAEVPSDESSREVVSPCTSVTHEQSKLVDLLIGPVSEEELDKEENLDYFVNADLDADTSDSDADARARGRQFLRSAFCGKSISGEVYDKHVDFVVRDKALRQGMKQELQWSALHLQTFSWSEDASSALLHYYPGSETFLDAEFRVIQELTYGKVGDQEGIDTTQFRSAIWNYVLRLKGVLNDDYNYSLLNTFVKIDVKNYVKTVVCTPQNMTRGIFDLMDLIGLKESEKVHVNILAIEARYLCELLHALNAINTFATKR